MTAISALSQPGVQITELHFNQSTRTLLMWCAVGHRTLHVTVERGTYVDDVKNLAVITVSEPGDWKTIATLPADKWFTPTEDGGIEPFLTVADTLIKIARRRLKI